MPDSKITALTALTAADPAVDMFPVVDVSDTTMAASGTTKRISINNILACSPSATLASATITGDLTVDTSTLKVDSTNNRVGVGTATPSGAELDVAGAMRSNSWLGRSNVSAPSGDCSIFRSADNTLGFGIASATAMTLNSTGLGVGRNPSYRFQASSGTKATTASIATVSGITTTDSDDFGIFFRLKTDATGANRYAAITSFDNGSGNGPRDLVLQDLGGNVGIGVTPSAFSGVKAVQLGTGALYSVSSGSQAGLLSNAYYDGAWKYISTSFAARYDQPNGSHQWFTAPSGTAGNAITFTQAMTLDASGNLLVGKTASSATTVGVQAEPAGAIVSTLAASTNATNTLICYSTGSAAYRFYVGLGGTVYATNTTISAISDSRLKENVQDIDVGLGAILALKPRKFDWKAGKGKDIKGDRGFIAQEFEQVFPQLVDEWKDAAPEGETPYKSVRQDLIPVLVKAIQELTARVQTLEAK